MKVEEIGQDSLLTSYEVGDILQVNPSSINKWVRDGLIQAFRTPGGHHRIRAGDLVSFLQNHKMPVPRRLVNAAKKRLLVVDDDAKQLAAIARALKGQGHRIELRTVDNGIDALVQVGAFAPNVVVLDVFMPGLDGVEVCKHLKKMSETTDVKVVITSGQLTAKIEEEARAAGAARCLNKPLELEQLLEVLELPPILGAQL
jgi:CheY-like chemotaxis protein